MGQYLTDKEKTFVREKIQEKYVQVARSPAGLFNFPTGKRGARKLGYPFDGIRDFPGSVLESFCGVGNPFSAGPIHQGEAILDIGCGAGLDAFVAARSTGDLGRVIGIDVSPEMIAKAQENLALLGARNVSFEIGEAEALDFEDQTFQVVISNGVFILALSKVRALGEAFRVLRPGGRFMVADMVLVESLPEDRAGKIENWYQ